MWSDKETNIDYLNFGYLVDLIAKIATDKNLSPSTIGLYGDWGSGKSSLMKLALQAINDKAEKDKGSDESYSKVLCVEFNGWLFEGYEDAKTSLCGTILDALADEKRFDKDVVDYAKKLIKKIDFKKILGKGIKYGADFLLTGGFGALFDITLGNALTSLQSSAKNISSDQWEEIIAKFKQDEKRRTEISNFRKEFKELLSKSKVENIVVFIDELDRCSPDTILEIFEAMRLFLFVDGMSFVIGADERLIQYAIKTKYKEVPGNNLDIGKEYLEKVIQYPITIPQLNHAEVNQFLSCLLLESSLSKEDFKTFLNVIHEMKPDEELTMELLEKEAKTIADKCKSSISLAKQISSVLAPSINGNPRQCKRFLNTLSMRQSLAKARGVNLDRNVLAKLLLAEYFKQDFFVDISKKQNMEFYKSFESGEEIDSENVFFKWKKDEWVTNWMKYGPEIADIDLGKYVYFSNVKNRYGHFRLDMLSPTARKCFEYLADGTETHRNEALKMSQSISIGERSIIVEELFTVLESASIMRPEILRSFTDFCINADMKGEALKRLMEIPAEKYGFDSYGQLTLFINNLPENDQEKLNNYLGGNPEIKKAIERASKLKDL